MDHPIAHGPIKTLGIDPGAKGALVLLEGHQIVWSAVFPTIENRLDPQGLFKLLIEAKTRGPFMTNLELVAAMPGNGGTSMFTFGKGFGYLEMTLIALALPYQLVTSAKWQKVAHQGIGRDTYPDPKSRSLIAARRLWPEFSFLATDRSKKEHDGLIDAALIAYFGQS